LSLIGGGHAYVVYRKAGGWA